MRLMILGFCLLSFQISYGQKTAVYTERTAEFERGMSLYNKGIYGGALAAFEKSVIKADDQITPEVDLLSLKSELMVGKSAVRIGKPDAEMLMLSYFRKNVPDALAFEAVMDLGNYYYQKKNYDEAISFYQMIDPSTMTAEQRSEIKFKEGYALFVKKKFGESKTAFNSIRNIQNEYYYPANYYYALSAFYTDDYTAAVNAFKLVQNSKKYKGVVPIHICQILLAQKKYDELVAYAEPLIGDPEVKKQDEIKQILGQAYFEMGQYDKALPYLEEFAGSSVRKREEDRFQLGVAYYKQKEYTKAIATLKDLAEQNSEMAMYAMFYMADSYLNMNDKQASRNAFFKASNKKFDPAINEEALFNFAKLSVELGYDREAITTLQTFKPDSKYYTEAQELISDVLVNTRDYAKALTIIESIPNRTVKMNETYQKVAFYRGLQLHSQKSWDQALALFNKVLSNGSDAKLKAQAHFWMGDAMYHKNQLKESKNEMLQFIQMASSYRDLPPQGGVSAAQYNLGYIYMREENYNESLQNFEKALAGFRNVKASDDQYVANRLLPDAVLRVGDGYLKRNNYTKAMQFYNEAIQKKYTNFVYAMYQSAMIEGLQGDINGKIASLKNIADSYANSDYSDDALLELATAYESLNRPKDGISALKRLVNEHGQRSKLVNRALLKMGLLYYNQNDYNNALAVYKDVFKNNPNKEEADAVMVAIKEIYINDLKRPDDYFAFAKTIPGYTTSSDEIDIANFQVADNYFEEGNYPEAIKAYTTYLQKYPSGARAMEAIYKRGDSYTATKQYDLALKDYKSVIGLGRSDYYKDALEKAAIISYNHSNAFNDAYTYYSQLIDIETREDKKFEAQLGALRSAYRIGKQQEVVRLADLVINNPRSSQDQKSQAHFFKAKSAQDIKDYNTALNSYNEVIKNSETVNAAESRFRIAQIYYQRKDLDMAESLCQEAMESNGEFPYWVAKSLILTADILSDKGDYFNARAALEAVIENFKEDPELTKEATTKLEAVKKKDNTGNKFKTEDGDLELDGE